MIDQMLAEARSDQESGFANAQLARRRLILLCAHGYSSRLAASVVALGLEDAGDVEGGFEAWREAALPVAAAPAPAEGRPGMGGAA